MYKKKMHIHFIGIGGIGMSGIAEILKLKGYTVSGCDETKNSKTIDRLKKIGCEIYHKHNKTHIKNADVLVYSSAVNKKNEEVCSAIQKGIPVIPRAIMLAELMRTKYGVAISGTHGKTTTTSMISHIFIESKMDPTVIIGGILKNISANAKLGNGKMLIAEVDESDKSLLYLNPTMAIVTNIEAEHLDTYKNLSDIQKTFKDFLARLPFYGKAFLCIDDPNIKSILPLPHINTIKYGFDESADIIGKILTMEKTGSTFEIFKKNKFINNTIKYEKIKLGTIKLNMPGEHNILNALAAIALSLEFEISFNKIQKALKNFKGVERRFEFKGMFNGAEIFDDYGHHPTEIKNTLKVAQKRKQNKLHVIFQPHRFTRTQKLWDDFVNIFADSNNNYKIDSLYLADIYPASENPIDGITSQNLTLAIQKKNPNIKIFYAPTYNQIQKEVEKHLNTGDLLLTVGAGKANIIGENLVKKST
ncbi:MAG: UDP-N-acetylmuramate--L-alanine ligase [bacterium]